MRALSTIAAVLLCASVWADAETLALQVALDRAGFSCNTIDGTWGVKSERALRAYAAAKGLDVPATPEEAYQRFFGNVHPRKLFRIAVVTTNDLARLVRIPTSPEAKAALPRMGYESIKEMFAERGHLSQRALERTNPGVDWDRIAAGTKLVIPDFPSVDDTLKASARAKRPTAVRLVVDLTHCEITAVGKDGKAMAHFPCSIARSKAKLPPAGELKVVNAIAHPNYTYTPDITPRGRKPKRHVWPEGENCPIGVAWLGLNLPGYGLHGTPRPESIGNAESHGCFRLANWNAARLYALCPPGTPVIIKP